VEKTVFIEVRPEGVYQVDKTQQRIVRLKKKLAKAWRKGEKQNSTENCKRGGARAGRDTAGATKLKREL